MALNWKDIAQPEFGLPPAVPEVKIYVDGNEYMAENKALQMKMSQERVMKLLEGIGINTKDVQYIADIGSSKEKNIRVRKLMGRMPAWLKPSGVFGIGLQSVFQLTDCIEFYTRQHNQPERQISIYSYGRNQGKIETKIVSEYDDDLYFDNAIPGTNVKIVIEPRKFFDVDKKRYYRNVSSDDFERFIGLCKGLEHLCKICLAGEGISVSELWNVNRMFRTSIVLPKVFRGLAEKDGESDPQDACEDETEVLKVICVDNICRLPHRLINIEAIWQEGNIYLDAGTGADFRREGIQSIKS